MRSRLLGIASVLVLLAGGLLWIGSRHERPPSPPGGWLAPAGLEAGEALVRGHRLRYVRTGSGSAVVLVHGFGSSLYTWKDVLPGLARAHDVVALDLPGFGWSEQPPDLSFDDLPAAVLGLMDALGVDRAALVGNSLGGAVVAVVAGVHPDRASALVLIDSAGFNLAAAERPAVVRLLTSPAGRLLAVLPFRRVLVELSLRQVFHDRSLVTEERVAEYVAPFLRPGALASVRSLVRAPVDPSAFARTLAAVEAPTLVVWGREDAWIPVAAASRFTTAVPHARQVVLEGCGHLPQEEKPAAVTRLLLAFLPTGAPG